MKILRDFLSQALKSPDLKIFKRWNLQEIARLKFEPEEDWKSPRNTSISVEFLRILMYSSICWSDLFELGED